MFEWLLRHTLPYVLIVVLVPWVIRPRFGKRGVVEIFLVNAIGDLVAHAAFEEQHPMIPGLGGIVLWVVFSGAMGWIVSRSRKVGVWLGYFNKPEEIVKAGNVDEAAMRRTRVGRLELESELRKQGISDLKQVTSVTVEPDGSMSIRQEDSTAQQLRRLTEEVAALREALSKQESSGNSRSTS